MFYHLPNYGRFSAIDLVCVHFLEIEICINELSSRENQAYLMRSVIVKGDWYLSNVCKNLQ